MFLTLTTHTKKKDKKKIHYGMLAISNKEQKKTKMACSPFKIKKKKEKKKLCSSTEL